MSGQTSAPLLSIFGDITSIDDLATLLHSSPSQLRYLLYARAEDERYTSFFIPKKSGGRRTIEAPKHDLKIIQRRLANFLYETIEFRPPVHGFVRQRSIVTNAKSHVRHRVLLNVDIKDFFPSINFGRVRGLFIAKPFSAPPEVATLLAQICCHKGTLPQGAPTSPIISNLVCARLDAQLLRLSREHKCYYSRYADDLTFSRRKGALPESMVRENSDGTVSIGPELAKLIERNGFQVNSDKLRLLRNTRRQSVTGLTVNSKVNVPRSYVRNIRAMIADWRIHGRIAAQAKHHAQYYSRHPSSGTMPDLPRILEGKLNFLKAVRGPEDPVRKNLQRQLAAVWPEYLKVMERENAELSTRDFFISHASEDKDGFVRPLVQALVREGLTVWYDEFELTIGDDLLGKISEGLSISRYGIVVLSHNFFDVKKTWPSREVGALFAQQDADGQSRILPLWHGVDRAFVVSKNPILAGTFAWKTVDHNPDELAAKFRAFLRSR